MRNKIIILIISLIFISCAQEKEKEVTDFDEINFFDVVYESTFYRPMGNSTWITITGKREVKFEVSTTVNEDQELPNDLVGEFIFSYTNYRISPLNPICNGGYQGGGEYSDLGISGARAIECLRIPSNERRNNSRCKINNITVQEDVLIDSVTRNGYFNLNLFEDNVGGNEVIEDPNRPWNVLDPYDNGDSNIVGDEEQIRKYNFTLNIGIRNFTPNDCENPFNPHDIVIYRFPNGTLIYQDTSKGIEYFMRPKLRVARN